VRKADEPGLPSADVGEKARREAARRAGGAPAVPAGSPDVTVIYGLPLITTWVHRHRVTLGGLGLIAAQLVWKAFFLNHFFFSQDDFRILDRALDHGFTWGYLVDMSSGHLIPGPAALAWVLARIAIYDWALATGVTLLILAAASLAAFRLLRTLFGDRPGILVPLAVYLITPLTLPDLGWWSSAIQSLPLQLATFMALTAHVWYMRTGRYRHVAAAAAWLAVGMLFFEKGMALPLLLFAVSSAFFADGRWLTAAWRCAVRDWKAWVTYAAVLGAYIVLLASQVHSSATRPGAPGPYRNVLSFMSGLVKDTFLPGAVGGPWQWYPSATGAIAFSAPPAVLRWLSWFVCAAVVAVSIWNRKHAWRAWAILAGWIVVADMVPVAIGQIKELSGALLGLETRYVADAAPVLAICIGLAFLPVLGRPDNRRPRHATARRNDQLAPATTAAVLGAFVIGSLWSAQAYQGATNTAAARAFITTARAALGAAPYGTVIVDQQVPQALTVGAFGRYSYASKVAGEMVHGVPPSQLRFTRQPRGTIDMLMVFGQDGRLHPAAVVGAASVPLPAKQKCWPGSGRGKRTVVVLLSSAVSNASMLRFAYYNYVPGTKAVSVDVRFAGQSMRLRLAPGLHNAYFPVLAGAGSFTVSGLGPKQLCLGDAAAGALLPSSGGPTIPPSPASG
jgi:hypothetical protein